MASRILPLDSSISSLLYAQQAITSISSAVRELLQNSLDAQSTEITILIDFIKGNISCKDNGTGLTTKELTVIGGQCYTSKITSLDDLSQLRSFGFKGLALNQLKNLSETIWVCSRCIGYDANCKVELKQIMRNQAQSIKMFNEEIKLDDNFILKPITDKEEDINLHGTQVIVMGLFAKLPVRKHFLNDVPLYKQFDEIKSNVFHAVVVFPNVKIDISYIDEKDQKIKPILLYTPTKFNKKDNNWSEKKLIYPILIRKVFNPGLSNESMKCVSIKFKNYSLKGIINTFPQRSKSLQFIFINGRKYVNQAFMKLINSWFIDYGFGKFNIPKEVVHPTGKIIRWYPLFLFDIKCPLGTDKLIQDPDKIIIETGFENILQKIVNKVVSSFLLLQGYTAQTGWNDLYEKEPLEKKTKDPDNVSNQANLLGEQVKTNLKYYRKRSCLQITNYPTSSNKKSKCDNDLERLREKVSTIMSTTQPTESFLQNLKSFQPIKMGSNCWLDIKQIYNTNPDDYVDCMINKKQIQQIHVIKQIEKKFILAHCPGSDINSDDSTLLIIDQHACDERIKLESFLQDYIDQIKERRLILRQFTQTEEIEINKDQFEFLKYHRNGFLIWGIKYTLRTDEEQKSTLTIKALSTILYDRCNGNSKIITEFLLQHMDHIECSKKSPLFRKARILKKDTQWYELSNYIPEFLMDIFNSKACRSAIMFGDLLTKQECDILVKNIHKCHFPFQCAHGRPSIIPLTILRDYNQDDSPPFIPPDYQLN